MTDLLSHCVQEMLETIVQKRVSDFLSYVRVTLKYKDEQYLTVKEDTKTTLDIQQKHCLLIISGL